MHNNIDYHNATRYETIIRKAFKSKPTTRNGAHLRFLLNAIIVEHNAKCVKTIKKSQKELETVKKYLSKALLKLARTKPYSSESHIFIYLEKFLHLMHKTSGLVTVIEIAFETVKRIRNESETN